MELSRLLPPGEPDGSFNKRSRCTTHPRVVSHFSSFKTIIVDIESASANQPLQDRQRLWDTLQRRDPQQHRDPQQCRDPQQLRKSTVLHSVRSVFPETSAMAREAVGDDDGTPREQANDDEGAVGRRHRGGQLENRTLCL